MRTLLLFFVFVAISATTYAQSRIGASISGGVITARPESYYIGNISDYATHEVKFIGASPTFSAGITYQNKIGWTFMQPTLAYNQYDVNFDIEAYDRNGGGKVKNNESYKFVDFSAIAGIHSNNFRLGVGPVFHFLVDFDSNLNIPDHQIKQNKLTAGFAGQIGYDLYPVSFDLKFENAFRTMGDHIYLNGAKTRMTSTPDQLTLMVTYTFGLDD